MRTVIQIILFIGWVLFQFAPDIWRWMPRKYKARIIHWTGVHVSQLQMFLDAVMEGLKRAAFNLDMEGRL